MDTEQQVSQQPAASENELSVISQKVHDLFALLTSSSFGKVLLILVIVGLVSVTVGLSKTRQETRQHADYEGPIVLLDTSLNPLPINNNGKTYTLNPNIKIKLSSTLGPPAGASNDKETTKSYKIAETASIVFLNKAQIQPYTASPTFIDWQFITYGRKNIYVQFIGTGGKTDTKSIEVIYVAPTPTPTPTSTPTPTPITGLSINLLPPAGSFTPNASGTLKLVVGSNNTITISGTINNFAPNRTLTIELCPTNKATCEYTSIPKITTNTAGSASFDNVVTYISNPQLYVNNPLTKAVVVILSANAGQPSGCSSEYQPCLEGSFPSSLSSTPTPTTSTPQASSKRIFVTSTTYNGNLGGLAGADAKCQDRANSANLGGTWKAWLSDNQTSAANRLIHSTIPYRQINNQIIANNWTDLTDGSLQYLPTMTELGINYYGSVWTGTNYDGTAPIGTGQATHCKAWTTDSSTEKELNVGVAGLNQIYYYWTNIDINLSSQSYFQCNNNYALYCFEQ